MSPGHERGRPRQESGPVNSTGSSVATEVAVPLKHGLAALYIRDTDPLSVALRKMRRRRPLNGAHRAAYEAWLAEQRQEAAS